MSPLGPLYGKLRLYLIVSNPPGGGRSLFRDSFLFGTKCCNKQVASRERFGFVEICDKIPHWLYANGTNEKQIQCLDTATESPCTRHTHSWKPQGGRVGKVGEAGTTFFLCPLLRQYL